MRDRPPDLALESIWGDRPCRKPDFGRLRNVLHATMSSLDSALK